MSRTTRPSSRRAIEKKPSKPLLPEQSKWRRILLAVVVVGFLALLLVSFADYLRSHGPMATLREEQMLQELAARRKETQQKEESQRQASLQRQAEEVLRRNAEASQQQQQQQAAEPTCPFAEDKARSDKWVDETFIDRLFTRLSTDPHFAHLAPQVIKSPQHNDDTPWILVLDNFLADVKPIMEYLTSEAVQSKFRQSAVAAGSNSGRQSETHDCQNECLQGPWAKPIVEGMERVTGLPFDHAEDISFTHYGPGGHYGRHHDYISRDLNPRGFDHCGPRILTFLVCLNDVPDNSGATHFFYYDLKVIPKAGRALIFPDVFPDRPMQKDERTAHEAMKVFTGDKYIAQTWFHPFDYRNNMKFSCCV